MEDIWLTREKLAARWDMPKSTLDQWASQHKGVPYAMFGRHARYRLADVIAWEAAQFAQHGLEAATDVEQPRRVDALAEQETSRQAATSDLMTEAARQAARRGQRLEIVNDPVVGLPRYRLVDGGQAMTGQHDLGDEQQHHPAQ